MPLINVEQLVARMMRGAQGVLVEKWPDVQGYAESEFTKIGEVIAFIEEQRAQNLMSDEKARLHLEMQKNTAQIVMLTVEGMGALAVEAAVNVALDVVKGTVNTALGFVLV